MNSITSNQYSHLLDNISKIIDQGRRNAYLAVSTIIIKTYWEIGKEIVEFEQKGKKRAEYGRKLLDKLYSDLKSKHGKGFSRSNVYAMRQFYLCYPNFPDASGKLTWSHFVELVSVSDDLARSFYEKQCLKEKWSIRELKRQIDSMLFERIALSKDKKGVLKLASKGQAIERTKDLIKELYVLEFGASPRLYTPLDLRGPPYFWGPAVPEPQQRGFTPLDTQGMRQASLFGSRGIAPGLGS